MNDLTFVTCCFFKSPSSRMGGRGGNIDLWGAPFRNILSLDSPLVIYSDNEQDQASKVEDFLKKYNFTNYKIIIDDLLDFKLTNKIFELKESASLIDKNGLVEGVSIMANQRNYQLCLKKMFWLRDQSESNPFNTSKFFWIDFGLCHHAMFPDSLGGMEKFVPIVEEKYWPINKRNMFTPLLAKKLFEFSEDKFFAVNNKQSYNQIIGGIFGGNKEIINTVTEKFDKEMVKVYENNILELEERILTNVYEENVDLFKILTFDVWNHDSPNGKEDRIYVDFPRKLKSFYRIFYNDLLNF